ncbi:hypothetical protein LJB89_02320 [Tyzzerella sp. OttesenSCG-928-J15]|nr:hypothetical protein [Tyzzerella sp. OttesenSCG-928-J15]
MKHGKKPTRKQSELISKYNLKPENWLITKDCPTCFEIVNRISGKIRRLNRSKYYEKT